MPRKKTEEQLSLWRDKILSDVLCSKCGKHIRTIRRSTNWIESEYVDAEGKCWDCSQKRPPRAPRKP